MLRSSILLRLVRIGDESTLAEARAKFQLHLRKESNSTIPADLRPVVYRAVLATGDLEAYEALLTVNASRSRKDMGLNVQEIPLRWIWLKICILLYFEVLRNV
jgi:hypothetical protein